MGKEKKEIAEVKKNLHITDDDIAKMFGYANRHSYSNSSAKPRIETGIVSLYRMIMDKIKSKLEL